MPQLPTLSKSQIRALAWGLSFVSHAMLVSAFSIGHETGRKSTSHVSVDLVETRTVNDGTKLKAGRFLKSRITPVAASALPSATESEPIAERAELAVFAAAGDQNAPQNVRDAYVARLRGMIERNKSYPIRARQLGLSGEVVVSFTILEDGHVTDVNVEKPCHHNILNRHAVEIVEHIENFEPIPQVLGLTHWHMTVPIEFALN